MHTDRLWCDGDQDRRVDSTLTEFTSGARSTREKPWYFLVPLVAIRYIAERLQLGAATHGLRNYMKGVWDEVFIQDRKQHMFEHTLNYIQGNTTVDENGRVDTPLDHLKAALTNGAMLAEIEEYRASNPVPAEEGKG